MPWGAIGGAAIGAIGSLIGGGMNNNAAATQAALQYQHQKEFAQNGVRWKVADAKAAGIHPLAALGAQTFSYNPVMTTPGDNGISEALGRMGQGVSRAVEAKALEEERRLNKELLSANINKVKAETNFVNQQAIQSAEAVKQTALPPAMPKVNAKSVPSLPGGYAGPVKPLLTLARVGRTLLDVVNPDFADSITESQYRSMIANVSPEWNVAKGYLKAPVDYLDSSERDLVKSGKYELVRFPGGWIYREKPKTPAEEYKDRHGKDAWHDPTNWKWLDKAGQFIKNVF